MTLYFAFVLYFYFSSLFCSQTNISQYSSMRHVWGNRATSSLWLLSSLLIHEKLLNTWQYNCVLVELLFQSANDTIQKKTKKKKTDTDLTEVCSTWNTSYFVHTRSVFRLFTQEKSYALVKFHTDIL